MDLIFFNLLIDC